MVGEQHTENHSLPTRGCQQSFHTRFPHKVSTYRSLTSFWTNRFRNNHNTHTRTRKTHFLPVLGVSLLLWIIGTGVWCNFPGFAQGQDSTQGLFNSLSKAPQEDSVSSSNVSILRKLRGAHLAEALPSSAENRGARAEYRGPGPQYCPNSRKCGHSVVDPASTASALLTSLLIFPALQFLPEQSWILDKARTIAQPSQYKTGSTLDQKFISEHLPRGEGDRHIRISKMPEGWSFPSILTYSSLPLPKNP